MLTLYLPGFALLPSGHGGSSPGPGARLNGLKDAVWFLLCFLPLLSSNSVQCCVAALRPPSGEIRMTCLHFDIFCHDSQRGGYLWLSPSTCHYPPPPPLLPNVSSSPHLSPSLSPPFLLLTLFLHWARLLTTAVTAFVSGHSRLP